MNRTAWLLFIALSFIWGVPYFFIKIALHDLSPAWIAFSRVALGAMLVSAIVPPRDWRKLRAYVAPIVAAAFTNIALPFFLIANGERYISSALTGLLLAAMPLVVALFAFLSDRRERLSYSQLAGLFAGLVGVTILLGFNLGHDRVALVGAALISGATLSYSVGILIVKRRLHATPTVATAAAILAVAACFLAPTALLELPIRIPGPAAIVAVVVLGAFCTATAYVMDFALIALAGATRASVVTYLNPAVAALLGIYVLGESLSVTAIAGLTLVIAGSWLSTAGKRRVAVDAVT